MKKILFVIVPVYNTEKYVAACLESILCQTYSDVEIIVIDDGSTDKSPDICREYATKHKNIHFMRKENDGAASARNYGINYIIETFSAEVLESAYLGYVDSDDYIHCEMYKTMMEIANLHQADIVSCGRFNVIDNVSIKDSHFVSKEVVCMARDEAIIETLRIGRIDVSAWDKIFRFGTIRDIRYPHGETNEDAVYIFNSFLACSSIVLVPNCFYYYRHHASSTTKTFSLGIAYLITHAIYFQRLLITMNKKFYKPCECYLAVMAFYEIVYLSNLNLTEEGRLELKRAYSFFYSNFKELYYSKLDLKDKICSILIFFHLYKPIRKLLRLVKK